MQPLFIWVICIIAISVIVIAMVRTRLKNKSKELAEKLNHISAYSEKSNYEQAKERLSALKEGAFIDIPSDLNNGFYGRVISATQEKDFINHYKVHFQEAYSLLKKLKAFNITPSETISKFINDFGRINKLVKQHNDGVITFLLDTKTTGTKPSICDNTDSLFVDIYHKLLDKSSFKKSIVEYFIDYQTNEADWEQRKNERREQLSGLKNVQLKAMFPDMDGRAIYVRSEQEQKICFALSSLGVKFRYEEPYEHQLADEMHSQYRPDFSIYFKQGGVTKRIYLEHFGVDEHGLVPAWFAKDKGITYEEANQKYNDGITWKKTAHEKFGTQLLVTSSADFHYSDIRDKLRKLLAEAGVPIQEKTDEELYDLVLPKGSKQEKAFIRLVVTFVTLVKSSCKSVKEVLKQAKNADDERSVFIIKNIFQPVYERYINALSDSNQIDFTDAILQ